MRWMNGFGGEARGIVVLIAALGLGLAAVAPGARAQAGVEKGVETGVETGSDATPAERGEKDAKDGKGEAGEAARSPRDVVEDLQGALLEAMKGGEEMGYEGRYGLIEPVVDKTHSTSSLARLVLGQHWEGLDGSQRERFVKALERLTTSAYAARFHKFKGESFAVNETREVRENVVYVRTTLTKSDGDEVSLDYVLREFEKGWRIVNIVANGVSEVSVKRAEYDAIIGKEGFEALLGEIEAQIEKYEAGEDRDLPG